MSNLEQRMRDAFHEAGFKVLEEPRLESTYDYHSNSHVRLAKMTFQCVCGRVEFVCQVVPEFQPLSTVPLLTMPFTLLYDRGAFSAAHLREDGYTEAEIADIRRPFEERGL